MDISQMDRKSLSDKIFEHYNKNEFDQALMYLEHLINLDGVNKDRLIYKYDFLIKLNKPKQALVTALALVEIDPRKSPWHCLKIAEAHLLLEEIDPALKWIETAIVERAFNRYQLLETEKYEIIKDHPKFIDLVKKSINNIGLNKPIRNFSVSLLNGADFNLEDTRGKVVLIDFWATWCDPCIRETPNLLEIFHEFNEKGFEIIAISLDKNIKNIFEYKEKHQLPWNISCSENEWTDEIVSLFRVNALPSLWLIDQDGILRHFNARGDELKQAVESLVYSDNNGKRICIDGVCTF